MASCAIPGPWPRDSPSDSRSASAAAASMSTTATRTPLAARSRAIAAPSPPAPPVTTATVPWSSLRSAHHSGPTASGSGEIRGAEHLEEVHGLGSRLGWGADDEVGDAGLLDLGDGLPVLVRLGRRRSAGPVLVRRQEVQRI